MTPDEHALAVLKLTVKYGCYDELFWFADDDGNITPLVNCNDLFSWASADAEEIEPADMPLLEATLQELHAVDPSAASMYGLELFACRKRKLKPQQPVITNRDNSGCGWWLKVRHLWEQKECVQGC